MSQPWSIGMARHVLIGSLWFAGKGLPAQGFDTSNRQLLPHFHGNRRPEGPLIGAAARAIPVVRVLIDRASSFR